MPMNLDDLKKLPLKIKILIICVVFVLIGYLYYMLFLQDALAKMMNLETKLADLQQQVVEKEKTAAQLNKYIREVNALKESYKVALLKLPNEREIAGLLDSVVQSGKAAGVDFLLFEPKPQEKKPPEVKPGAPQPPAAKPPDPKAAQAKKAEAEKFYDEIPIKVQLAGGFHNTLSFFERVAQLPRIVNIEDITMGDAHEVKGRGRVIKTSCTVKTYMFVDRK
ncbi:MAG: type IV pilus inner membrane component PilO [Syntrophales bacterium]